MRNPRKLASIAFGLLLLLLVAPLSWGQTPAGPRLDVHAPERAAVYDTVAVSATAYSTINRRSPTSRVTWLTRPSGAVIIQPDSATKGQTARVVAVARGATYLVATWARTDGLTIRDSAHITIGPAIQVDLTPFQVVAMTPHGIEVSMITPQQIGERHCVYALEHDKHGNVLTGIPVTWRSSNESVATVGSGEGLTCADTSVDPARLLATVAPRGRLAAGIEWVAPIRRARDVVRGWMP